MTESVVSADAGAYRGATSDSVTAFLGIEYGTVQGRRFRDGVRLSRHDGVRDCLAYGPVAMQFDSRLLPNSHTAGVASLYFPHGGQQAEGRPMSEDCLTLNIWSPEADPRAHLPVLVWIHGGAFRAGSASATVTHGARLAAQGRAVIVSVAHRLGVFGFTPLGDVLGEDYRFSGVAGLTDIALALEWIGDNISAFGGDANRVTLVGQSGGANKIHALLSSQRAASCFSRAVLQSPADPQLLTDVESAAAGRELLMAAIGLEPGDAADLLTIPPTVLTRAQGIMAAQGNMGPVPVLDGEFVDLSRTEEISGNVPTMVGHTSHDFSFFLAEREWFTSLEELPTTDQHEAMVMHLSPFVGSRERVVELLRTMHARHPDESASLLAARVATEVTFAAAADSIASERALMPAPVYRYEFAHESDSLMPPLGATHCVDVPFVFDTVDWAPIAGESVGCSELAQRVGDTWLAFVESGDPTTQDAPWVPFTSSSAQCMLLGPGQWASIERVAGSG